MPQLRVNEPILGLNNDISTYMVGPKQHHRHQEG
jgi:hypothetical protein